MLNSSLMFWIVEDITKFNVHQKQDGGYYQITRLRNAEKKTAVVCSQTMVICVLLQCSYLVLTFHSLRFIHWCCTTVLVLSCAKSFFLAFVMLMLFILYHITIKNIYCLFSVQLIPLFFICIL